MTGDERSPARWNIAAGVVAAAAGCAAVAMLVGVARRAGDAVHAVTPATLAVAAGGAAVALFGLGVMAASRHRDVALLGAIATLLLLVTVLLGVLGIVLLPLVVLTAFALARHASGRLGVLLALASGPAAAVGFAVVLVVWVQPPLVRCHDDGASTTSRPWWDSSSGAASGSGGVGSSGRPHVSTGTIDMPSGTYTYRCAGGELTDFRRSAG